MTTVAPPPIETSPTTAAATAAVSSEADRLIDQRIVEVCRALWWAELVRAVLKLTIAAIGVTLVWIVIDQWFYSPGPILRWLVFLAVSIIGGGYALTRIVPLLGRSIRPEYAARSLERDFPELRQSLTSYIALRDQRQGTQLRHRVVRSIGAAAAGHLRQHDELPTEVAGTFRWWIATALSLGVLLGYAVLSPKNALQSASRLAAPFASIDPAMRVRIQDVQPGDTEAIAGRAVTVSAKVEGLRDQERVIVRWTGKHQSSSVGLELDTNSRRFVGELPLAHSDGGRIPYTIEAGDAIAGPFELKVQDVPVVAIESVQYNPPAYTGQPSWTGSGGAIQAVDGTQVVILATTNRAVAKGKIEFNPRPLGDTVQATAGAVEMAIDSTNNSLSVAFPLRSARGRSAAVELDSYQVSVWDAAGQRNPEPIIYPIRVIADLPPEVAIMMPKKSFKELPIGAQQVIEVHASDPDFGLQQVAIEIRAGIDLIEQVVLWSDPVGAKGNQIAEYRLRPTEHRLRIGDTIKVIASSTDNRSLAHDPSVEPNVTRTDAIEFKIVANRQLPPAGDPESDGVSAPDRRPANDQQESGSEQGSGASDQEGDQQQGGGSGGDSGGSSQQQSSDTSGDPSSSGKGNSGEESSEQDSPDQSGGASADSQGSTSESDNSDPSSAPAGDEGPGSDQGPSPSDDQNAGDESTADGSPGQPAGRNSNAANSNAANSNAANSDAANSVEDQPLSDQPRSDQPASDGGDGTAQPPSHDGEAFERIRDLLEQRANEDPQRDDGPNEGKPNDGDAAESQNGSGESSPDPSQDSSTKSGDSASEPSGGDRQGADRPAPEPGREPRQDPTGNDPRGNEASGETPDDRQGIEADDQANPDPEASDPEASDPEASDPEASDPEASDPEASDPEASDRGGEGQGDRTDAGERQGDDKSESGDPAGAADDRQGSEGQPSEADQADQGDSDAANDSSQGDAGAADDGAPRPSAGDNPSGDQGEGRPGEPDQGQSSPDGSPANDPNGQPSASDRSGESSPRGTPKRPTSDAADRSAAQSDSEPGIGGQGEGEGGDSDRPADQANQEYTKRATDMVLDYLKETRDKPDRELLDKLNWTEDDLKRFADRWQRIRDRADNSRDPKANRELSDALKSLGMKPKSEDSTSNARERADTLPAIRDSGNRRPPPAAYRNAFDQFRRAAGKN